jgi:hypothetical protein
LRKMYPGVAFNRTSKTRLLTVARCRWLPVAVRRCQNRV